jgi:hypothetical protein
MSFLIWIRDLLFGSFTPMAAYFAGLYKDAGDGGLSLDWGIIIKICIIIIFWLGSAFFAGSIAESKGRNRLLHFLCGLLIPWIYPFFILFYLTRRAQEEVTAEDKEKEEDAPLPIAPKSHFNEEDGDDANEEIGNISQSYLSKIATDELGGNRGPFIFVFEDGKTLEVNRIVSALPDIIVVELVDQGEARTVRFPYAKISSCVRKEDWDPNNLPVMKEAAASESPGLEKKKDRGFDVKPSLVSKLRSLAQRDKLSPAATEETAKFSLDMTTKSTHIGSYVILKPATIVGGCRIISELGRGGMGMVYLAHHTRLEIPVAIKVVSARLEANDETKVSERFLQEAKIAARIRHPHLVSVMDAGKDEENELFYIVMEYMDGGTVGKLLENNEKLAPRDAMNIILAVAEALSAGQRFNIVHRDIKPANIMLTDGGDIKLCDLGLAKMVGPKDLGITTTNLVMGSVPYMSPEQARDFTKADFRSDVYSLGATLFHILTGSFPYNAGNPLAIIMKATNDPTPNPCDLVEGIDPDLASLCMKMMDKKPEERYQTPDELLKALYEVSEKMEVHQDNERKNNV